MEYREGDKLQAIYGECVVVREPDKDGWMIVEWTDGTPTGLHVANVQSITSRMARFDTREVW